MNLSEASKNLYNHLLGQPWFLTVGEGDDSLFLYVKNLHEDQTNFAENGWKGFPVDVRVIGKIKALNSQPMTFNFTNEEQKAIHKLAEQQEMSAENVIKQALRMYQMVKDGGATFDIKPGPSKRWVTVSPDSPV